MWGEPKAVAVSAGALQPVAPEAELPLPPLTLATLLKRHQRPSFVPLLSHDAPWGRAFPAPLTR